MDGAAVAGKEAKGAGDREMRGRIDEVELTT